MANAQPSKSVCISLASDRKTIVKVRVFSHLRFMMMRGYGIKGIWVLNSRLIIMVRRLSTW